MSLGYCLADRYTQVQEAKHKALCGGHALDERKTLEMDIAIGALQGLAIGGLCRWLDIPSPAPLTPIGALLVVAMLAVHPDWSIAEGQFGWLLLIISGIITITITMAGPGAYSLNKGKSA